MVLRHGPAGHAGLVVPRDSAPAGQTARPRLKSGSRARHSVRGGPRRSTTARTEWHALLPASPIPASPLTTCLTHYRLTSTCKLRPPGELRLVLRTQPRSGPVDSRKKDTEGF